MFEEPLSSFACDVGTIPRQNAIRRLSHVEYENTWRALCSTFADESAVFLRVKAALDDRVPDDALDPPTEHSIVGSNFQELDQNKGQAHVDGFFAVAGQFATLATENDPRIRALAGDCATDADTSNDAERLHAFLLRFGARTFRRELSSDELDFFANVAMDGATHLELSAEALRDVLVVMLSSPDFLYRRDDRH